jgi:hypothetical protein
MTSIEWLEQKVKSMVINGGDLGEDYPALLIHIQQAKEMHKQEIIEACNSGYDSWFDYIKYNSKGEQYYKETYDKTNG